MYTTNIKPETEARAAFDGVHTRLDAGIVNSTAAASRTRHGTDGKFRDQSSVTAYIILTGVGYTDGVNNLGVRDWDWVVSYFITGAVIFFFTFVIFSYLFKTDDWASRLGESKTDKIGLAADLVWLIVGVLVCFHLLFSLNFPSAFFVSLSFLWSFGTLHCSYLAGGLFLCVLVDGDSHERTKPWRPNEWCFSSSLVSNMT